MKTGDRIRLTTYVMGHVSGTEDFTIEEFRFCLGIFTEGQSRKNGMFTPLCDLYEDGPDSEDGYTPHMGPYRSNQVPIFMNLPRDKP